jgi:hypothetical protein
MKTRFLELMNQINKYSMKLSELRYELSLKQEEFNSSAEDLRLRYEQELESLIRKLIATIEDKKLEISNLQAKQNSIQADITRICNELSLLLHELEKKEKNKNYLQLFSANRGVPEIKNITNEKIEAALSTESSKIVDGSPSKGDQSSTGKMKNTKQKKFLGNVSGGSKSNKIINHLSKVTINKDHQSKSEDSPMNSTLDSQAIQESSTVSTLPDNVLNDDNDPNYIFTVFPFLDTNEITEEMVLESLKITDKLLMDFEDKKRELSIQEEKVNSEKNKIQNLLRSEENKTLERLKLTVNNLQEKIESDGKRGELLQTLIKNLSSEGKVTHRKSKLLTPSISNKDRKGNDDSKSAENKTENFAMDLSSQPSEPSKAQLKVSSVPVLNEIEHNVIKYQELFEKCHSIIQTEREKVFSRGRSREAVMENAPTNFKPFNPSNDSSKLNFKENYHADSNYRSEQRAQIAALEHKRNIKRIVVPHQISKIHKAIEMFDYYGNLPELSEIEKIQNTLLPYTNFPMSRSANRASATDDLKKGSTSQKQSLPSSPLNKSRPLSQKSVTFTSIEEVQFKAENADFDMLPTTHQQSSQGRRSAISSRSSIRSKSPELLAALSATVDQFNKQFSGEKVLQTPSTTPKSRGYQLTLKMEEQENRQFFLQDYGFKLALEQISSIYNLLLKWNHPGSANPSLLNGNIVVQTDQEENNLVTIELLKSQIEQLLAKIKSLYRQNTYYNSIIKDLSKDLVSNMKKSSTLQTELYSEIRDIKWNQNSLPGKYQMEMDILKERILTFKKECKVWEDKVAKRRLTNIRLSQMLSESSKTVRRSLPVRNQIKMVPAILKDSYPLEKLLSIEEPVDANYRSISDDHNYGKPGTSNTQFSDLGVDVEPSTLTPRAPDILKMGSSLDEPSLPDISISR